MTVRRDRELIRDISTIRNEDPDSLRVMEVVDDTHRRLAAQDILRLYNGDIGPWEELFASREIRMKNHTIRYLLCLVANVLPRFFAENGSHLRPQHMISKAETTFQSPDTINAVRHDPNIEDELEDDELAINVDWSVLQNRVVLDWFFPKHLSAIQDRALTVLRTVAQEAQASPKSKYADPMASHLRSRKDEDILTWTTPDDTDSSTNL